MTQNSLFIRSAISRLLADSLGFTLERRLRTLRAPARPGCARIRAARCCKSPVLSPCPPGPQVGIKVFFFHGDEPDHVSSCGVFYSDDIILYIDCNDRNMFSASGFWRVRKSSTPLAPLLPVCQEQANPKKGGISGAVVRAVKNMLSSFHGETSLPSKYKTSKQTAR